MSIDESSDKWMDKELQSKPSLFDEIAAAAAKVPYAALREALKHNSELIIWEDGEVRSVTPAEFAKGLKEGSLEQVLASGVFDTLSNVELVSSGTKAAEQRYSR